MATSVKKISWNLDTQYTTGRLIAMLDGLQGQIQDAPAVGEAELGSLGAIMHLVAGESPIARAILEENGGTPGSAPLGVAHMRAPTKSLSDHNHCESNVLWPN
jgi:hypothetical protein